MPSTDTTAKSVGTNAGARGAARTTTSTDDSAEQTAASAALKADATSQTDAAPKRQLRAGQHPLVLNDDEDGIEVTFQGERRGRFNSAQLDLGEPYQGLVLARDGKTRVSAETAEQLKRDKNLAAYKLTYKEVSAQTDEQA